MSSSSAAIGNYIEGRQRVNWLAIKLLCIAFWREGWFAVAGFTLGTGAAVEAGGEHESSIVAGLVAGAVTLSLKLAGLWWERRKERLKAFQENSKAQQQSADKVAELTVEERRDIRALMQAEYERARGIFNTQVQLLEKQIERMDADRTQDLRIIDNLSTQLRVSEERRMELEERHTSPLGG